MGCTALWDHDVDITLILKKKERRGRKDRREGGKEEGREGGSQNLI